MSLRDDLDFIDSCMERLTPKQDRYYTSAVERLRAALTPAAEKWLEALPEVLEAKAKRVEAAKRMAMSEAREEEWDAANDLLLSLVEVAVSEAAALHNAQDNKEQK